MYAVFNNELLEHNMPWKFHLVNLKHKKSLLFLLYLLNYSRSTLQQSTYRCIIYHIKTYRLYLCMYINYNSHGYLCRSVYPTFRVLPDCTEKRAALCLFITQNAIPPGRFSPTVVSMGLRWTGVHWYGQHRCHGPINHGYYVHRPRSHTTRQASQTGFVLYLLKLVLCRMACNAWGCLQ